MINPLLFSPSPRDISTVLDLWETLQYDHLIEKYKKPLDAHQDAKKFFLKHIEYTHLVVCPDDLEVTETALNMLVSDIMVHDYPILSGMCNLEEIKPHTYNFMRLGTSLSSEKPPNAWVRKKMLPKKNIFQVAYVGLACEFISRKVMEKVSFRGAHNNGQGNFDWQFSRECNKLGIPIMVDQRVNLWHRRKEQYLEAKAIYEGTSHVGEAKEIFIKRTN